MKHISGCFTRRSVQLSARRCLFLVFLAAGAFAQNTPASRSLLIKDVTVIHASTARIQSHVDVLIAGTRIAAVGATGSLTVPESALVVDARGKFLIPGLWDMHTHALSHDRLSTWLPLFVANGVLGIRDMGSGLQPDEIQALKNQSSKPSPHIVASGKTIGGFVETQTIVPASPEEGREAVSQQKRTGSDFIKVYTMLPARIFSAIAEEARKQDIPLAGHVPLTVPLSEAAAAGLKSFEHSYGVLEACSDREESLRREIEQAAVGHKSRAETWGAIVQATDRAYGMQASDGTFNRRKCEQLGKTLSSRDTWQCPTLVVRRAFALLNDPQFTSDPQMKYIAPPMLARWKSTLTTDERSRGMNEQAFADRRIRWRQESETTVLLMRNGVPVLAGTDCGNPFLIPGSSLHDELALLVDAGLTPMEALESATTNPARFLGKIRDFGTVDSGKIADLILLSQNPLANIRNTRRIESVILNGKLYDRRALDTILAEVETAARKYRSQ